MKPLSLAVLLLILTAWRIEGSGGPAAADPPPGAGVAAEASACSPEKPSAKHLRKHRRGCAGRHGACSAVSPRHVCCFGLYCRDLSGDRLNCGACGRKCGLGMRCCGGACANVRSDRRNCGRCGKACRHDESCTGGLCGYA
ncbi:unnamed protein product [Spirodela intermedia]|uniref:Uncharacterized protein n=2 Tax=Spirodela intermedia TaxID=51605 RepID=A0A7I8IDU3_SPIIN|nr:unnamed protein product [Spirodela intermedia]CAA6655829.1 unnamed protein product [Spirodela intermedia]CAA7391197.1 unnamed protein product [Spirodela intermedia]